MTTFVELGIATNDIISNSWVENDLRVPFWHIWLELVVKVNPIAHKASMALDAWLGLEGISGGSISDKATLSIEASMPMSAKTARWRTANTAVMRSALSLRPPAQRKALHPSVRCANLLYWSCAGLRSSRAVAVCRAVSEAVECQ